jgi:hypothetical protein
MYYINISLPILFHIYQTQLFLPFNNQYHDIQNHFKINILEYELTSKVENIGQETCIQVSRHSAIFKKIMSI